MRTGVIVAMDGHTTPMTANRIMTQLVGMFPGVTFALVAGATSSVAFQFDTNDLPQPQPEVEG